ncbi:cytochrome d ubiquinol oxidase subunit II [Sulfitobacter donghicola]|uniref:Ubiquinol oxidase subunit II, cyanide insensitive n=1 Tax=Sulfitobacter donghicola DSW-25 = KCTC 12864 = JCM 14565 TaxID=1300350 RepID=A0A073IZB8_9RHOB|nr:cytochrome d ubiquinol oxidase subunit II [Sulfitobacter donghicola]KEJ90767.1 ubiquinol oxidase subunit II, cyanide insensitive [Sulfitobacter donghicola DSW-25 = KCTC 12864 = JCM 14565]KIN68026.1 Cytochrome d ubiquinol oxidase, subunit II [Sulfitobacter donghicola DSW-25 = KCTC 12864 = JCM 14565]
MFELSFIWAGIIAFAVLTYVILDGFDLGVGILFPFAEGEREKATMMNSIAPIWDGNETWLVMGGGGLFAVFPLAYAVIMPALYIPITIMLLALIFRGVAFEYRWRTERWKPVWDAAFFGGSIVAAFMQGISLGALVQGIEVADRAYAGGWWDWLSLFSVLTGLAVIVGYALLGATWIILKTEGSLQRQMQGYAWWLAAGTLGFVGFVSILTPFQDPIYFQRWFNLPGSIFSVLMPGAVLAAAWALFAGLNAGKDAQPFLAALCLFILCFIGIGISFYPNMVPPSLTIAEAAAPDESLWFALVGTLVLVPMILAYTAYTYWVFRGKVDPEEGYH